MSVGMHASAALARGAVASPRRRPLVITAGAKGGGGKQKPPPGTNPFASSDLLKFRSTLPSEPSPAKEEKARGRAWRILLLPATSSNACEPVCLASIGIVV